MAPALELEIEQERRPSAGARTRIVIAAAVTAALGSDFHILRIGTPRPARPVKQPAPVGGHARLLAAKASGLALRRTERRRYVRLRITLEDTSYEVRVEVLAEAENAGSLDTPPAAVPETVLQPPHCDDRRPEDKVCRSPIAGMVVSVDALPGHWVRQDDPLIGIEAMKMQNTIGAPVEGIVEEVLVKPGELVKSGQVLCTLS